MLGHRGQDVHGEEEEILAQDGHLGKSGSPFAVILDRAGSLDPRPSDVDVEENKKSSEPQDARIEFVI